MSAPPGSASPSIAVRPPPPGVSRRRSGRGWGLFVILATAGLVIVGIPFVMAVAWSLVDPENSWSYPDLLPPSLSLYQWQYVFKYTDIVPAIITSYTVAAAATFLSFVLSLPTAYGIARYDFRGKEAIRLLLLVPLFLPGMIIALFLGRVFDYIHLSQTFPGLVLGHTLLGIPFMSRLMTTSFQAIPNEISDAASNLGASELRKFREVYIPMIRPGIFAGAVLTFITSLEEFALTFVIGTPAFQTIPTVLFSFLGYHFVRPHAAVVALILLVPNVVVLFLADRLVKRDVVSSGYGRL